MTLLGQLRGRRLRAPLAGYARTYEIDAAEVARAQLAALNAAWAESLVRSPWARALQARLELPGAFPDWQTFESLVPIQRKADLRPLLSASAEGVRDVGWRSTGGTTAEPMRFPVFETETQVAALDIWLGRSRLGIAPQDRLFLIWGHSHLFGTGFRGAVNRLRRRLSDAALGYARWNAYHLSPDDLAQAAAALLASRARYVIGYASALDRFARANLHRAPEIRRLNLAVVIATAEGFPRADSREVVAECFGCPVVMEYGAVETGPMAYERAGGGGYDVFWAHHRLETTGPATAEGGRELVVTSLYPRALPLLRYAIGDLAIPGEGDHAIVRLAAVSGRCNEAVTLPGGAVIHSEAFTHAVRDLPGVRAYQIVRRGEAAVPLIRYEADQPLTADQAAALRARLALVDRRLGETSLEWSAAIPPSVAGKHRMVVDEA